MTEVWSETVITSALPLVVAFFGRSPAMLDDADLDLIETAVRDTPMFTAAMRRARRGHLHGLRRMLYEAGMVDRPARIRHEDGPLSRAERLRVVAAPEIRRSIVGELHRHGTGPRTDGPRARARRSPSCRPRPCPS